MTKGRVILIIATLGVGLLGCKKGEDISPQNSKFYTSEKNSSSEVYSTTEATTGNAVCGSVVSYDFIAGQHINVGTIDISNDANTIYVTYNVNTPYSISETHLYVGDANNVPRNNSGTPIPGQFPYKMNHDPTVMSYTYSIPMESISNNCFDVFAHASVVSSDGSHETAWSNGTSFNDKFGTNRWGWFSNYCIQECNNQNTCYADETAWSYGTSFKNLTGTNRWGWYSTYTLNQTQSYDVFAGQTNQVGVMTVSNNSTDLQIDIVFEDGAYAELMHLYVGNVTGFLTYTNNAGVPVPGQFPIHYTSDNKSHYIYTMPLSNINYTNNEITIAAHFETKVPVACE